MQMQSECESLPVVLTKSFSAVWRACVPACDAVGCCIAGNSDGEPQVCSETCLVARKQTSKQCNKFPCILAYFAACSAASYRLPKEPASIYERHLWLRVTRIMVYCTETGVSIVKFHSAVMITFLRRRDMKCLGKHINEISSQKYDGKI